MEEQITIEGSARLWFVLALALAATGPFGCNQQDAPVVEKRTVRGFMRGDRVLVELRGAEFFEGRVLSSVKDRLRVEPQDRGAPLAVAAADAYKLPPSPTALRAGQLAVCRAGERWIGCRIGSVEGAVLRVVALDAREHELSPGLVLAVSDVTELNLKQAFARARAREEFRAGVDAAGSPRAPAGTRLLPRARVVARRGAAWYSGIIQELERDGAHIEFSADSQRQLVKSPEIVPEPPHAVSPGRGEFALARPDSPSQPWQAVRVIGPHDQLFRVVSADGVERVVSARDLLPLTPD